MRTRRCRRSPSVASTCRPRSTRSSAGRWPRTRDARYGSARVRLGAARGARPGRRDSAVAAACPPRRASAYGHSGPRSGPGRAAPRSRGRRSRDRGRPHERGRPGGAGTHGHRPRGNDHGSANGHPARASTPPPPPPPATAAGLDGHTLNDRGYSLQQRGDYTGALPLLQQAVRRLNGTGPADPYEGYANYNLGYTLYRLGRCPRGSHLPEPRRAARARTGTSRDSCASAPSAARPAARRTASRSTRGSRRT